MRTPIAEALRGRPRAPPEPAAATAGAPSASHDGAIERPPGVRLDLGGSAKGFIADRVAHPPSAAGARWTAAATCASRGAHAVLVRHPLTGGTAAILELDSNAVATSGVDRRAWRQTLPPTT